MPDDFVAVCCKRLPARDPELLGHEIDTRDRLRHRVLHLDAAVELEEEELVALEDELDGARAPEPDRSAECDRGVEQRLAHAWIESRSWGLLEHLLVASLDRAVALAERDDVAV